MPTPEEIAAKKAADKKAADEAARKAKLKDDDDGEGDDDDSDDDDDAPGEQLQFTKEQKAYVDGLRKENAKARVKNKELETGLKSTNDRLSKFEGGLKKLFGGEDNENLTPEQRIERLEQKTQQEKQQRDEEKEQLALDSALKGAALEHGVGKADYDYFEFLVGKKLATLKDDEELSDEDLKSLAKQAKAKSAAKSTSVDGAGPDPDEDDGEITVEEFMELGIGARSALYQKDKALYEKLVLAEKAAKKKK